MSGLRQSGVALITALIFTALVTTFAVAMAARQELDIRRSANIVGNDRSYLFALGIEEWARKVLSDDAADNQVDHLGEDWNAALPAIHVDGATVTGKITDLQGLINVNGLVDANGAPIESEIKRLQRLLRYLELNEDLVFAIVDWIDPDTETSFPGGAEDSEYLNKDPAYRAANAPLVSISELRLVQGMDRDVYARLQPFVTALPPASNSGGAPAPGQGGDSGAGNDANNEAPADNGDADQAGNSDADAADNGDNGNPPPGGNAGSGTAINVNTAPAEVLLALAEGLTLADAESLIERREEEEGFQSISDFLNEPVMAATNTGGGDLGLQGINIASEYFLIQGNAVFPDARMSLYTVVRRDAGGKLQVISRGQGSY